MSLVYQVEESKPFELHEEAEWYSGILYTIEEAEDRGYGPGLKWVFHLDGEVDEISGTPRETWGFSGQKITPRTKAGRWVTGIRGSLPEAGQPVDLSQLIGARVQVMFEHGEGLDRDGNKVTKDKVDKVRAAKTAQAPAEAPQAAPEPAVQPQAPVEDPF